MNKNNSRVVLIIVVAFALLICSCNDNSNRDEPKEKPPEVGVVKTEPPSEPAKKPADVIFVGTKLGEYYVGGSTVGIWVRLNESKQGHLNGHQYVPVVGRTCNLPAINLYDTLEFSGDWDGLEFDICVSGGYTNPKDPIPSGPSAESIRHFIGVVTSDWTWNPGKNDTYVEVEVQKVYVGPSNDVGKKFMLQESDSLEKLYNPNDEIKPGDIVEVWGPMISDEPNYIYTYFIIHPVR